MKKTDKKQELVKKNKATVVYIPHEVIFSPDLTLSESEVLCLLFGTHFEGLVPLNHLHSRWTMKDKFFSKDRMPKQLEVVLRSLEKKGWIARIKGEGRQFTAVKLLTGNNGLAVPILKSVFKDLTLSIKELRILISVLCTQRKSFKCGTPWLSSNLRIHSVNLIQSLMGLVNKGYLERSSIYIEHKTYVFTAPHKYMNSFRKVKKLTNSVTFYRLKGKIMRLNVYNKIINNKSYALLTEMYKLKENENMNFKYETFQAMEKDEQEEFFLALQYRCAMVGKTFSINEIQDYLKLQFKNKKLRGMTFDHKNSFLSYCSKSLNKKRKPVYVSDVIKHKSEVHATIVENKTFKTWGEEIFFEQNRKEKAFPLFDKILSDLETSNIRKGKKAITFSSKEALFEVLRKNLDVQISKIFDHFSSMDEFNQPFNILTAFDRFVNKAQNENKLLDYFLFTLKGLVLAHQKKPEDFRVEFYAFTYLKPLLKYLMNTDMEQYVNSMNRLNSDTYTLFNFRACPLPLLEDIAEQSKREDGMFSINFIEWKIKELLDFYMRSEKEVPEFTTENQFVFFMVNVLKSDKRTPYMTKYFSDYTPSTSEKKIYNQRVANDEVQDEEPKTIKDILERITLGKKVS